MTAKTTVLSSADVLSVLRHHAAGMRSAAGTRGGLTLTPKACANTADELQAALAAVASLIERHDSLQEDSERWREVARRFDQAKTSASERILEGLGLDIEQPHLLFATMVDAARHKRGCDEVSADSRSAMDRSEVAP